MYRGVQNEGPPRAILKVKIVKSPIVNERSNESGFSRREIEITLKQKGVQNGSGFFRRKIGIPYCKRVFKMRGHPE